MYSHFFSYEWVKDEHKTEKPTYDLSAMVKDPIPMIFTTKNKVEM
jgi:hypothetical protein